MKKNILLALIFIFAVNLIAQECKYAKNEVDPFTGETLKYSKDKEFFLTFHGDALYGQFRLTKSKDQEKLTFNLSIKSHDERLIGFKEGQNLYLKLENDSLIQLTGKLEKEKMYYSSYILKPGWLVDNEYNLTRGQLEVLKKSLVKQLRLYYYNYKKGSEEYFEYDSSKNLNPTELMKLVKCID